MIKNEEKKNLQETQECAYICDEGKASQIHGHAISLAGLLNNYQTIKLR